MVSADVEPAEESLYLPSDEVDMALSHYSGGGTGLFARRSYRPGELILEDPQFFRLPAPPPGGESIEGFYKLMVDQAAHDTDLHWKQLFENDFGKALYRGVEGTERHLGYEGEAEGHVLRERVPDPVERAALLQARLAMDFNAYSSHPSGYRVLFGTICKANHSCAPNGAVTVLDEGPGKLVCLRPISAGEEITVTYLNPAELAAPWKFRQSRLFASWEFRCQCSRCILLADNTRRLACPQEGCTGFCTAIRAPWAGARCASSKPSVHEPEESIESGGTEGSTDELPLRIHEAASKLPPGGIDCISPDCDVFCDICMQRVPKATLDEWGAFEREVEALIHDLPSALFSAWALCEEFANMHREHWLTGRWKSFLARHIIAEAQEAEDADELDEAAALRAEAAEHLSAWRRSAEAVLGMPPERLDNGGCDTFGPVTNQ
eukprot:gnl/TRDRNA2_/TRDRNA2_29629_c0_seq1.p1 gnl/TRDRNA2_/TRDRNA2_29629_c0~~gnl/TRDRNA2_/TRDRNA2_29629_c0_seq1.p1  ORF type:complete len:448 (-),score=72.32 gnl/TRDRNA2_/TRDRNA2_29629_c0_seq1:46-1353(-)